MTSQNHEPIKQGQSTRNGLYRVQYDPAWSPSRPFKLYYNGTAGRTYYSFAAVKQDLRLHDGWSNWV